MESITSAQNPKLRNLLLLQEKSKARREQGLFVVEGRREIQHCLEGGFEIDTLFLCEEIAGNPVLDIPHTITLPRALYEKASYRGSTEGMIAEVRIKERRLEDLPLPENPLIIVLESVEKPGNIGAVLRSADAAGADALLICDPLTDLWNPNLIRASLGAVFTVPVVFFGTASVISHFGIAVDDKVRAESRQVRDAVALFEREREFVRAVFAERDLFANRRV